MSEQSDSLARVYFAKFPYDQALPDEAFWTKYVNPYSTSPPRTGSGR